MNRAQELELFDLGLNEYERKLNVRHLLRLRKEYSSWHQQRRHRRSVKNDLAVPSRESAEFTRHDNWELSARLQRDASEVFEFLKFEIKRELDRIERLDQIATEYKRLYPQASTEKDQRHLILDFAANLGATRRQLKADAAAFHRWFDHEAVMERYHLRLGESQQRVGFLLQRTGVAAGQILAHSHGKSLKSTWGRLQLERTCLMVLGRRFDKRVQLAALRCLRASVDKLREGKASELMSHQVVEFLTNAAMDYQQDIWIQREALGLLRLVSPASFDKILRVRLENPQQGDDLFVRSHAVKLLGNAASSRPSLLDLIPVATADLSPFVRQKAAEILTFMPSALAIENFRKLAVEDTIPQVRAAALVAGIGPIESQELHFPFLRVLCEVLSGDADPFVLRTAIHVSLKWLDALLRISTPISSNRDEHHSPDLSSAGQEHSSILFFRQLVEPALRNIQESAQDVSNRRQAAQARERVWLYLNPAASRLAAELRRRVGSLGPGKSRRVPKRLFRDLNEETIGRILAVLAQDDFGYDLQAHWWSYRITRGPLFRFRLWRFLFELRSPSPEKRQGVRHSIGRVSYAFLRVPSSILGEVSETNVPGEPLFHGTEGGWRSYLPLVDDVLSMLNQIGPARPVRFFTSEGVTELVPPRRSWQRLLAYLRLTMSFSHYARLRNWDESSQDTPAVFVTALTRLGIQVRFQPHRTDQHEPVASDASVLRFFPCLLAVTTPNWIQWCKEQFLEYSRYFTSVYENSLLHLLIFAIGILAIFFSRHVIANQMLRRARTRIPVSIGGWGTRGKSGTERLKAAVLNALGYSVFSKTTGCEAMFLYAGTYGELNEFNLYRPNDKATIWEHRNVLLMAARLRSTLFLWECMGLTPAYVEVLQNQWTRDDLATITNAFPDHENLQGPAGINVAQAIADFVPQRSTVLTSEQQMLPVLEFAARKANTTLRGVGWLESGLLTNDILDRFPYTEHPDNIALVQRLSRELGCDADFALKEMADCMVPDMGVLKTFPTAVVHTRRLEFTNGMSANERLACLSNWRRLGFDRQDHIAEPDVWVSPVVNNRADRVARSRAFAKILVHDISADRHFLVGSNLNGLLGFIRAAWKESTAEISLWHSTGERTASQAHQLLDSMAKRFRQYTSESQIESVTRAMLTALADNVDASLPLSDRTPLSGLTSSSDLEQLSTLWREPDRLEAELRSAGLADSLIEGVLAHLSQVVQGFEAYQSLSLRIDSEFNTNRKQLNQDFLEILWTWFEHKLVVIDDQLTSGEKLIHEICRQTPPGYRNRIMGLQNIKGEGLELMQRWRASEKCHQACQMIGSKDLATAQNGLRRLVDFQDFGLLCEDQLRSTIRKAERSIISRRELTRIELATIESHLDQTMAAIRASLLHTAQKSGTLAAIVSVLEEFLDVTDAIRRRKTADQIYKDLVSERISHKRAALEVLALSKRQKGGWMAKKLDSILTRAPEPRVG